jgi:hypothetical protein
MTTFVPNRFAPRLPAVAAQAALLAMAAAAVAPARGEDAIDEAIRPLVQPASTFELGLRHLGSGSYKANEYTGLKSAGPFLVGDFDLRRGGGYGSDDPSRFRLTGTDVGTESRDILAQLTLQGRTRFYLDYDQLLRDRSDSYQTPLLGAGTSVLTLPAGWLVPVVPRLSGTTPNARGLLPAVTSSPGLVAGVPTAPTAAQLATAAAIQAADLPAFHTVDLYTKRTRYTLGTVIAVDQHLELSGSLQHEHKNGLKPMGVDTAVTGGDISVTLPDLIDQNTDQLDLGATFRAGGLSLEGGYYASVFHDLVPGMTWSNWALPTSTQTTSSPPSNRYQQFHLTAAWSMTPTTRLVADASYGRATQDAPFLTDYYTAIVPRASADALVVTKVADLKFTSRPLADLSLAATYKFDDRDNRTPVDVFGYYDVGASPSGTSPFASAFPTLKTGSNLNLNANRPFSKRAHKFDLDVDYHFGEGQALAAGLGTQNTTRYCRGSWISCEDAAHMRETSGRLEWRGDFEALDARVAAEHARRTVDYNEDAFLALVPFANVSPTGAPGGSTAYGTLLANGWTGYGPVSGLNPPAPAGSAAAFFFPLNNVLSNTLYGHRNRISELPGMRRFDMADRTRDKLRTSVDWHATERFDLQAGLDLNRDDYDKSVYGLRDGKSLAANLDASWTIGESASVSAFATHEDLRTRANGNTYTANSAATSVNGATAVVGGCFDTYAALASNYKIDYACLNWSSDIRDKVDTLGATLQHKGLLGGRLEVDGSAAVSLARSTNDMRGGNYVNNPLAVNGAPAGTPAAYYVPATPLPVVRTRTVDLHLNGRYAVSRASTVHVGYRFQRMFSSDWSYEGLQYGGLNTVLPTNERAPVYTVHTVLVSYVYTFQ